MKNAIAKAAVAAASLTGLFGTIGTASGHENGDSLGAAKLAIDTYQLSCDAGSAQLFFQALAHGPAKGAKVSVLAVGPKGGSKYSTDPNSSDSNPSPGVAVADGPGLYYLVVYKNARGARDYVLDFHCEDQNGSHTSQSELIALQDR